MILQDHYAGYRNSFTWEAEQEPVWNEWDYALADAYQVIQDFTDNRGHLKWEIDSERVTVDAVRKVNKAEAAVERKTSKENYKPVPGEYYVTELQLMRGKDQGWPTMTEYFEKQAKQNRP